MDKSFLMSFAEGIIARAAGHPVHVARLDQCVDGDTRFARVILQNGEGWRIEQLGNTLDVRVIGPNDEFCILTLS